MVGLCIIIIECYIFAHHRSSTRVEAAGAMHEKGERLSTIRDLRQSHLWQTVWLDFESFQVSTNN